MRPPRTLVAAASAVALSCVLPDRFIGIVDEKVVNKHPVRFVEPTPVTAEADDLCLEAIKDETAICQPGDPSTNLPQFLDPLFQGGGNFPYRFCSCDAQESDNKKLLAVTLYVEDRANDVDDGLDPIYAALQLDLRPDETQPQQTVEYIGYVDPSASLDETELKYAPPRRPNEAAGRELREVNLGLPEDRIDLCNGAGTTPLTRGFHTLRVLVTDAPWFIPPPLEKGGAQPPQQFGVPDLPNGATYDSVTYVFHCGDKTDDYCDEQCQGPQ